ncbi:MAG: KH domain-containing protein [Solirubrobacterales bacterium]
MQEMLLFMVRSLVDDRGAVEVDEIEEDDDLVYEVTVAEDDLGRVIGRGGRVAKALRTVARAAARDDRRVLVDILD